MRVDVTVSGLKELRSGLQNFSDRRFNAALATALTRTAVAVRTDLAAAMQTSLDRPTPYTQRQLRYVPATAQRLAAAVGFNVVGVSDMPGGRPLRFVDLGAGQTPAGKYLTPQIDGGGRRLKRFEQALQAAGALPAGYVTAPGQGANVDAYGNISRGQVIQILSQLRAQLVAGTNRNMSTGRSSINAQKRAGGRFFVVQPGGQAQPGIYQREFIGRTVTPVLIFVKSANYRRRFDFDAIAQRTSQDRLQAEVARAIRESALRLAARAA